MGKKQYSKLSELPRGEAPETIIPGCIVLEGGAFRGMYTAGVLDVLMREGINLQCTIGVSAGAANGASYIAGHIGRAAYCNLGYRYDSRYVGLEAFKNCGSIVDFDFVINHLPEYPFNHERLNRPERRLIAVACNVETGEAEYLEKGKCGDIAKAVQASGSLPYASRPIEVNGKHYLDGGSAVKIAYPWAIENGFEKIVVVRTRDKNWRYDDLKESKAAKTFYRKRPEFAKVLADTHRRYNEQCDELERLSAEGRVFVIAPSKPVTISRLEKDLDKLADLYYLGRDDGENILNDLKNYLGI